MEEKLNIFMVGNKTWPDIQFFWQNMIDVAHDLAQMLNIEKSKIFYCGGIVGLVHVGLVVHAPRD